MKKETVKGNVMVAKNGGLPIGSRKHARGRRARGSRAARTPRMSEVDEIDPRQP